MKVKVKSLELYNVDYLIYRSIVQLQRKSEAFMRVKGGYMLKVNNIENEYRFTLEDSDGDLVDFKMFESNGNIVTDESFTESINTYNNLSNSNYGSI